MSDDVSAIIPHARGDARNLPIQWLRAIAALMVMLFHASVYGVVLRHDDTMLRIFDGRLGISGVSLFFAISGYLMAIAVQVQRPFVFLAHRVVRIYPAMLIAAALYCGAEYLLRQPLRIGFASLMLAPIGPTSKYPLRVEWTLVFEVTFYITLFIVSALGGARRLPVIAAAWLFLLIACHWLLPDNGAVMFPLQRILLACETVGMAGGLLIPSLLKLRLPPLLLVLVGASAWPIYTLHPMGNEGARWLFGIGATLVIAGAIGFARLGHNPVGRALARFGDYSYALYLIHVPVIYTLYTIVYGLPFILLYAIAVVVTILAAILFGQLDVALYQRLKSKLKTVEPAHMKWALIAYLAVFFAVSAGPSSKAHVMAGRIDAARALAAQLGPVASVEQAQQAALAAGFKQSPDLQGAIETAHLGESGLQIDGWAVDGAQYKGAALLALYQNGHLLDAGAAWFARPDIQARFTTKAKTGFGFELQQGCDPANPIIGLILAPDRRFAVMPAGPRPDCSQPQVSP